MDQSQAKRLFDEGAMFVFLDVPEGTEFGIDCNSWTVASKFKGVKMIPPGIHYIYYSSSSKNSLQTAPRIGFFHCFSSKEILIRKWNKQTEEMINEDVSKEEVDRVSQSKQELDQYLGAYPYDSYKKWVSLTDMISYNDILKLQPNKVLIYSASQYVSEQSNTAERKQVQEEKESNDKPSTSNATPMLPDMPTIPGSALRLTNIPKQKHPPEATPQEISKHNMDHSYLFRKLVMEEYGRKSSGILAEIQFTFVCTLIGMVYEAFEQWKQLVHLICNCEEAITTNEKLFSDFIQLLYFQLKEIPADFFVDIISRDNFLTTTLPNLFENIEECGSLLELKEKSRKFRKHLENKYQWDFSFDDESNPAILTN